MTDHRPTFPPDVLDLLGRTEEVDIETRAADGTLHRTIIWVVVVDGAAYIRSHRGSTARWYREIVAQPDAAIIADGRRIELRAVAATDPASVDACTRGLETKYAGDPSTLTMVAPAISDTTLRLEPR